MAQKKEAKPPNKLPSHHGGETKPEDLDPTPVEMPLGHAKPRTLSELIAQAVHQQIAQQDDDGTPETWEEANDFEEEDPDLLDFSKYELQDMEDQLPAGMPEPDPEKAMPIADLADPRFAKEATEDPQEESGSEKPEPVE